MTIYDMAMIMANDRGMADPKNYKEPTFYKKFIVLTWGEFILVNIVTRLCTHLCKYIQPHHQNKVINWQREMQQIQCKINRK